MLKFVKLGAPLLALGVLSGRVAGGVPATSGTHLDSDGPVSGELGGAVKG